MFNNKLSTYKYVCPDCFNVIKECECKELPITLIQIDKNILPIVKELNRKLFITDNSCEGHIGKHEYIHISFKWKPKFNLPFPANFEGDNTYLSAKIEGSNKNEKKENKQKLLKDLYEWACNLEELSHF